MAKANVIDQLSTIVENLDSLKERSGQADLSSDDATEIEQEWLQHIEDIRGLLPKAMKKFSTILGTRVDFSKSDVTAQMTGVEAVGKALNFNAQDKQSEEVATQLSLLTSLSELAPEFADQIMGSMPGYMQQVTRAATAKALQNPTAAAAAQEVKAPVEPARVPDVEKVAQHALTLMNQPGGEQALCIYLADSKIMDTEASHALVELSTINPEVASRIIESLPIERQTSLVQGEAGIDKTAILSVGTPDFYVTMITRQLENDLQPEKGITDRNNMSAAFLLKQIIGSHDNAKTILGLLGKKTVGEIVSMRISKRSFDQSASQEAQREVKEFWNENKTDIRHETKAYLDKQRADAAAAASAEGATSAAPIVMPKEVNLDEQIDLDNI